MPRFVLAANGSHLNRGCEAIERGTLTVLRAAFEDASFVVAPFGQESEPVDCGRDCIRIPRTLYGSRRLTPQWALKNVLLRTAPRLASRRMFDFSDLGPVLNESDVLLQLGGDNFSLDYGGPEPFFSLNDYSLDRGCPVVIWGASVGPFCSDAAYERRAIAKLREVALILVRETRTYEYLASHGLEDQLALVADPAFAMEAGDPADAGCPVSIPSGSVGVNLSPLYARYAGNGGTRQDWVNRCADVVERIALATGRPIVLVPHVVLPAENDHELLSDVATLLSARKIEVQLLPASLGARELKWCIGRMSVFVGSRTHSTIAALSQAVPTVSLAYSVKAYGINVDLLGGEDYLVPSRNFDPGTVAERVECALANHSKIRALLQEKSKEFRDRAFMAGSLLQEKVIRS